MKTKDLNISKISFVCAVMVIALHSFGMIELLDDRSWISRTGQMLISYMSHGLATVAVPTFFFLSGYLLFKTVDTLQALVEKLKKRMRSLVVPYICWNVVYFVFYICTSKLPVRVGDASIDFSLKGIIEAVFFHKYCYNLWFLLNLIFYTFVLSIPSYYLLKTKKIWLVCGVLLGITLLRDVNVGIVLTDTQITIFSMQYFIYWLLGVACSKRKTVYSGHKIGFIGYFVLSIAVMFVKETDRFTNIECILVLANTICFLASIELWAEKVSVPNHNMNMILYGGAGLVQIIYTKVIFMIVEIINPPTIFILLLYLVEIVVTAWICYIIGLLIKKRMRPLYLLLAGNR